MFRRNRPPVVSITGARTSLADDVSARTRRYLISMTIRTVCFVGAVIASGPLRWFLVACAILLPYIAVVMANAGRESGPSDGPEPVPPQDRPSLPAGEDQRRP